MGKHQYQQRLTKRQMRQQQREMNQSNIIPFDRPIDRPANIRRKLELKSQAQYHYLQALQNHTVTFALGPAGTGKTHVPTGYGCELLMNKEIEKIILTRPMVGVDEDMGALPGTVSEKFDPYFAPVREIAGQFVGFNNLDTMIKNGKFVIMPMQFLRGVTFDNALVILDESQNATPRQMLTFLTRIGKNCTVAVNGDLEQADIKGTSGLKDAIDRFRGNSKFGFVEFEEDDILRSDIVRDVILAYRNK